jgi:hypothetical protein
MIIEGDVGWSFDCSFKVKMIKRLIFLFLFLFLRGADNFSCDNLRLYLLN